MSATYSTEVGGGGDEGARVVTRALAALAKAIGDGEKGPCQPTT